MKILTDTELEYIYDCLNNLKTVVTIILIISCVITFVSFMIWLMDACSGWCVIIFLFFSLLASILFSLYPNPNVWIKLRRERQREYFAQQRKKNAQ